MRQVEPQHTLTDKSGTTITASTTYSALAEVSRSTELAAQAKESLYNHLRSKLDSLDSFDNLLDAYEKQLKQLQSDHKAYAQSTEAVRAASAYGGAAAHDANQRHQLAASRYVT